MRKRRLFMYERNLLRGDPLLLFRVKEAILLYVGASELGGIVDGIRVATIEGGSPTLPPIYVNRYMCRCVKLPSKPL